MGVWVLLVSVSECRASVSGMAYMNARPPASEGFRGALVCRAAVLARDSERIKQAQVLKRMPFRTVEHCGLFEGDEAGKCPTPLRHVQGNDGAGMSRADKKEGWGRGQTRWAKCGCEDCGAPARQRSCLLERHQVAEHMRGSEVSECPVCFEDFQAPGVPNGSAPPLNLNP